MVPTSVRRRTECGRAVLARGVKPDGSEVVALNVSTMSTSRALKMAPMDGRSR
jgi:hypothetical protein